MNTEKEIKMSLDLAKQVLGKDEAMDMLIKQNFSDTELGINSKFPKKWEDIGAMKGFWINKNSNIEYESIIQSVNSNKNILPTKELAEAMLALCQLLYLRDIYNDGWVPNWADGSEKKYAICNAENKLYIGFFTRSNSIMSFKTEELRGEFYENFKDLLETAKPLL